MPAFTWALLRLLADWGIADTSTHSGQGFHGITCIITCNAYCIETKMRMYKVGIVMKENVIGDVFSQYRALSLLCYIYSCKSMFLIIYSFVLSLSSQQQPKSGLINLTLTRKEANFVLNALNNFFHTYMSQMLYAGQSARQIVTFLSDF